LTNSSLGIRDWDAKIGKLIVLSINLTISVPFGIKVLKSRIDNHWSINDTGVHKIAVLLLIASPLKFWTHDRIANILFNCIWMAKLQEENCWNGNSKLQKAK
jgi:hypothetical protein